MVWRRSWLKKKLYCSSIVHHSVEPENNIYLYPLEVSNFLEISWKTNKRTWCIWEKTNAAFDQRQASWNVFSVLKHLEIGKSPRDFIRKKSTCLSHHTPAVSSFRHKTVMKKRTLCMNGEGLWLPQTLPALWMRDPPFKWKQREEMRNGPKDGQHGLALDAWGWGCHTGLQGKLAGWEAGLRIHGGHLIEPWGNILFCSLPPGTRLHSSVLRCPSPPLKGLSKSQRKKCNNTPWHAHSSPSQLSVEHFPMASPHLWLIISETFAAIAWVYFFPFPG